MFQARRPVALLCVLTLGLAATYVRGDEPFRYPEAKHGKGELRYVDNIPVLRVEGSPEEMGEQAGVLALKPAIELTKLVETLVKTWGWEAAYPIMLRAAGLMAPQFPKDHLSELDAAAKASGWSRDLLIFTNSMPDIVRLTRCSTLVVEPERSTTGAMLFGRNLDWPPAGPVHEYPLVIVYRGAGKRAFAAVTHPGMIGCLSAMNDAGLCIADLTVYSSKDEAPKVSLAGVPYILALRRVLEECATVEEAEKLLGSLKRTVMHNVAVCDKKRGGVFESTSKSLVFRPAEGGLCPCTNHFRTKELSTGFECRRFSILEKCQAMKKLSLKDVAKQLDAVNQGEMTLQTMIFEPASLRLHLAYGQGPATRLPLRTVDLAELLAPAKK